MLGFIVVELTKDPKRLARCDVMWERCGKNKTRELENLSRYKVSGLNRPALDVSDVEDLNQETNFFFPLIKLDRAGRQVAPERSTPRSSPLKGR